MTAASKPNPGQMMAVTGAMAFLARHSELHAGYRVAQLMDRVWPSITSGHFCLYTERQTGKPAGFCIWNLVSQAVLDELLEQKKKLQPKDWDSGDIPFFPEMIAPYGHLPKIISDLRGNAMRGVPWAYSIRGVMKNNDGSTPEQRTFKWRGRKFDPDHPNTETATGTAKAMSPIRVI